MLVSILIYVTAWSSAVLTVFCFMMSTVTLSWCLSWHLIRELTYLRGGPKNNRNYFFKWFIRFYIITTLVSFKVLSFWLDALVPTFFPLLKTFLELFSADVVQDLQRFLFHFADISKTFPFHLAFHTREQEKVA